MSNNISDRAKTAQKIREQGQHELLKQLKQTNPSNLHALDTNQLARLSPEQRRDFFVHMARKHKLPKPNTLPPQRYSKTSRLRRTWICIPILVRSQLIGLLTAGCLAGFSAYILTHENALRTYPFAYSVFYGDTQ